jgi:hypothetical protein
MIAWVQSGGKGPHFLKAEGQDGGLERESRSSELEFVSTGAGDGDRTHGPLLGKQGLQWRKQAAQWRLQVAR